MNNNSFSEHTAFISYDVKIPFVLEFVRYIDSYLYSKYSTIIIKMLWDNQKITLDM